MIDPIEFVVAITEEQTKKEVCIGRLLSSDIFEQIQTPDGTAKYALYQIMSDGTWRLSTQSSFDGCIPMPQNKNPLTTPYEPLEYESEQQLYRDVKAFIHKHLDLLNPSGYDILAAFTFSSWIPELFDFTPYLGFYGRESVGKTRGLEVLKELCFRAWLTTGLTTATLFRLVERFSPTLLLDESEFLTSEERRELISLLNAGQRRGVMIPRMKGEHAEEVEFFSVYCPKSIAGTEQLKRTTTSRMVTFTMTKNIRPIPRTIDKTEASKLTSQLLMWRFHKIAQLKNSLTFKERIATTELKATTEFKELEPLSGRTYELFYPLYYSAPTEKQNILQFATELEEIKLRAEKTELSTMIFEAILNLKDRATHGLILLKDITQYINAGQPPQYWIVERRVGTKCSQMGFEKTRTNQGVAIILNPALIERLRKDPRYSTDLLNYSEEGEESEAKRGSVNEWV